MSRQGVRGAKGLPRNGTVQQADEADDVASVSSGVTSRDRLGGDIAAYRQAVRQTSSSVKGSDLGDRHCGSSVAAGIRIAGHGTMPDRYQFISRKYGIPQVDLDLLDIASEVLVLVPSAVAQALRAIPVIRHGETLIVAMDDPTDTAAIDQLRNVTGHAIEVFAVPDGQFDAALQRLYPS
jgi:hypothetical protein